MALTVTQKTKLTTLAQDHGMRLYATAAQVGIGYAGELAFCVVFTPGAGRGRQWSIRNRNQHTALAQAMRAILVDG